jgi:hypothetical protein
MAERWKNSRAVARRSSLLAWAALVLALSCWPAPAQARPNTHAPAISTWDTRASNIMFGYHGALFGRTSTSVLSYSANFASTSGVLLAQFGLHYVSYQPRDSEPVARGVSAGGVALFNFPLAERYSNGVPPSAFAFYIGGVPTALISGRLNYLSVPGVLGVGVPLSPGPSVTLTPWIELSPGLNFDTRINEVSTDEAIDAALDGTLTEAEVEDLVRQGLDAKLTTSLGARAGLSAAFHLGERVDLNADLMLGGGALTFGGGLVIRWDEMVPGVRPAAAFSCADIDERVRACRSRRGLERPHAPTPRMSPKPETAPRRRARPSSTERRRAPTTPRPPPPGTATHPGTLPRSSATGARPGTRPSTTSTRAPAKKPVPRPGTKPAPARTTAPAPSSSDAFPPLKAAPP